jgi:5,5'-dehydrodivanillate O-demethylase oxygenase subunit
MTVTRKSTNGAVDRRLPDFEHTGPGTLAGRYLRSFWQPVHHAEDIPAGRSKPITIMGTPYTLYRGADGAPHLVDFRCPHRGTQLSTGWVEGDAIRCFYHGWKFDGSGQCVEQPAEPKSFAHKVRIGSYPCRDYIGLVFAYLGEGKPPEFPRYPEFENFEGILELDSYLRECNYFNNLENAGDLTHSGFAHRNNPGSFDGFTNSPVIKAKESCWGVTVSAQWPDQVGVSQIGMPNIFHHKAQPTDPSIAIFREFMAWWVPLDDTSHIQFTVAAVRLPPDKAKQYLERRAQQRAKQTSSSLDLAAKILKGEMYRDEVDPATTDFVRMQDHIAQGGQGAIADRRHERLGQGDNGVIQIRKIWTRELRAFKAGRPLKKWIYDPQQLSISRGERWEDRYRVQAGRTSPLGSAPPA